MKSLIKYKTDKTPADKKENVRYNEDSNLLPGVPYSSHEHMAANTYQPELITALYADSVKWMSRLNITPLVLTGVVAGLSSHIP